MILNATNKSLELVSGAAGSVHCICKFADVDDTADTFVENEQETRISSAATTTIVSAPSSGVRRLIKGVYVLNEGTGSQTISIQKNVGGTVTKFPPKSITLAAGESLVINDIGDISVYDALGRQKVMTAETTGYNGQVFEFLKIGTAAEAIGVKYAFAKDSGFPGAWVPGSPGINGWWTDASQASNAANPAGATQTGSPQIPNPSSGANYLTEIALATSVAHFLQLLDLLWYNTGIAVTTTTAQAITMPASSVPARDLNGSTNGEGWNAGIYVTTATTNAGAITNTQISYTNSEGVSGRTGTISSFPATAVAGTFVPFQLQAGDRGIRSIQSITLGTSYGGGAISLVLYRLLGSVPNPLVNVGGLLNKAKENNPGIRLYNGTALWLMYLASATTATNIAGSVSVMEK